jgi:hypothetical protein
MKSIYNSIWAIFLIAVFATSCNTDVLDIEQHGVNGPSTYQTADDAQVRQFIAAVYAVILGDAFESVLNGQPACYPAVNYEMSRMSAESANYYAYNESADAGTYSYIWSYYYRIAYWCNMIIAELPANNVATEGLKNQVLAEARTIRAITMMNLVQLYGNPPLVDHILDGSEGNTPAADSWEFIENELQTAAGGLPSKSAKDGQGAIGGRLTREAAYAYLGKAQLWQKKYSEAAKTLHDKVIATGLYELNGDFATLNGAAVDFSPENIWEFDFADDSSVASSQVGSFNLACYSPNVVMWGILGGEPKYASLLLAFGMSAYPSSPFAEFMNAHDKVDTYGIGIMSPTVRYSETLADYFTVLGSLEGYIQLPVSECQGYIKIKDLCRAEDVVGTFPYLYSKRNVVYMRYAEVLLNYAEAVAMGGVNGALSGLDALNLVRRRAGLTDAPALDMDNTGYGVKAERRAELYGEGHRFIDLVRWGDAVEELKDCGKISYTFIGAEIDYTTFQPVYNIAESSTGGSGFQSGKHELFPIPSSDVNSNPKLDQNPGWR